MKCRFACILAFCLFAFLSVNAAWPLRVAVISDIHYLSPSFMDNGSEIQGYEKNSAKNIRDIPALLEVALKDLESDAPDVLLIPGDLTKDGELQSHLGLKKRLDRLAALGTRIFVIPGNHDISVPHPVRFEGDKTIPVANISPEDFARIYQNYGFAQSFSRDSASLSYAVALDDNTWLIAIDSNRYKEYSTGTISSGRVLPETEKWVVNLLSEAKKKHVTVFGMIHHGLVEHFMYQNLFFADYLVNDWKRLATVFANNGMKAIFTGHFHANDITQFDSPEGNRIYDIETGSLSSFPFPYRRINWDGHSLAIRTPKISSIPGKPDLAKQDSIAKLNYATQAAVIKIKSKFPFLPDDTAEGLGQLIGRIYIMHVRGDEKMDNEMRKTIENFSSLMGGDSEIDLTDLELDFPPQDNELSIEIK
jgi:3',5'-cyclic AMP phosphodiesterase CpdA